VSGASHPLFLSSPALAGRRIEGDDRATPRSQRRAVGSERD
jgi:hypothetical protein